MLILAYHSINPNRQDALSVHPDIFVKQIDIFRQKYEVVTLDHLIHALVENKDTDRMAAITFDDGYRDNFLYAYPLLKERNLPATIFLIASYIGTDKALGKPGGMRVEDYQFLSWEEIKEMGRYGISFGSHTFTHPLLTCISRDEAIREIRGSRTFLEERIGAPIEFFCYPFGEFNEAIKEIVINSGYRGAVITPSKALKAGDLYALKRVGVYRHNSLLAFRFKISPYFAAMRDSRLLWGVARGVKKALAKG